VGQAAPLSSEADRLRVIMCIAFDKRAPLEKVKEFKTGIVSCPNVLHSVEVSGTFDFMFEAAVPDLAWYHQKLEEIAVPLQTLAARVETNFVCCRKVKPPPGSPPPEECKEAEIWVPYRDGRRRILAGDITAITAERDYVRIHLNGSDCLFHCTLKEMLGRLDPARFIRIHRSVVVRRDLVERLLHEERHWKVRLVDGSVWPVAKSHEREVMEIFTGIQSPSDGLPKGGATNTAAAASAANFMLLH
jgi:DNA-binding LytR/AlgR family response regulator